MFGGMDSSLFTHGQLKQVLSAYAEGVLKKGWRDYAISCDKIQTTFGVIERGEGAPVAVIYSISVSRVKNKKVFKVMDGQKPVFKSENFLETLNVFREIGKSGQKKTGKFKIIK
jgi:hypothetical protein